VYGKFQLLQKREDVVPSKNLATVEDIDIKKYFLFVGRVFMTGIDKNEMLGQVNAIYMHIELLGDNAVDTGEQYGVAFSAFEYLADKRILWIIIIARIAGKPQGLVKDRIEDPNLLNRG